MQIYKNLYPARTSSSDPGFPSGKAVDAIAEGSGTPVTAAWVNDLWGAFQAILDDAGTSANATAEKVGSSQVLDAIKTIISGRASRIYSTVASLRTAEPEFSGQSVFISGHTLAGQGAGVFRHVPSDASADDNGVVIVNGSGDRWIRDLDGKITPEMFGFVSGSSNDQTAALTAALVAGDALGLPVEAHADGYCNVDVTGISINLIGRATLRPFSRTTSVFRATSEYEAATSVSSISTYEGTVSGIGGRSVSAVVSAGHTLATGDIVKVVSEDLIPTTKTSDNSRNGEMATVTGVDGSTVYLDRVLDQTYTTSPRIAKISDRSCRVVGIKFQSTTGNGTSGAALAIFRGFRSPEMVVGIYDNDGVGLVLHGTYAARVFADVRNLTNNTSLGMYGYGVVEACTKNSHITIIQSGYARHAYTTGAAGDSTSMYDYGEPEYSYITGESTGATSNAFDTHEQGVGITFGEIVCTGVRSAFQSRSRRTRLEDLRVNGADFLLQVNETATTTEADVTIGNIQAYKVGKPFNLKTVDFANPPTVVIEGVCYIEYDPISPGASTDSQANLTINGTLHMVMTGGADYNVLAQRAGDCVINGVAIFDTLNGGCARPFNIADCKFTVTERGSLELKSTGFTRLFTSTDTGTASTAEVRARNVKIGVDVTNLLWFEFPCAVEQLTLTNTANQIRSSSFVFTNTGDTTEFVRDSFDPVIYWQVSTDGSATSITALSDGNFAGQMLYIENSDGATLDIPDTIGNVTYSHSLAAGERALLVWRGTEWR